MLPRLARIVGIALAFVGAPIAVATGTGDDAARAHHPWARFAPGTWIRQKSVNDYVMEGKKHHDESTERITLKAVTDKGVKLVTEGKGFRGDEVNETTEPFDEREPWAWEDRTKAPQEKLTIEGKEIVCAAVHFDCMQQPPGPIGDSGDGPKLHVVGTAWLNDAYAAPLKLELEASFGDEKQRVKALAEHLDVEIKVGEKTFHCVEVVSRQDAADGKSDESKSVQHEWFSAEMPGGFVRTRAESTTDGAPATFLTEVTEFFVAPAQEVTRTSEAPVPAPLPEGECEITARFVGPDGQPATALKAHLHGRTHDAEAAAKAGIAAKEFDRTGATDADGRLKLDVEALKGTEYFVEVRGPGIVKEVWRLRSLVPGGHVDLGQITTRPCGAIVGRMLTADGRPVPGGYYVQANLKGEDEEKRGANREPMYEYGMPEKGSSEYRVDNIPPGTYEVSPYVNAIGWFKEGVRTVDVVAGQESRLDLTYTGPALDRRVHIIVFVQPFYTVMPGIEHVSLKTADGRTLAPSAGGMQAFNFDDVPEGSCTLTIDDPRFEKVTRTGLRAGTRTDVGMRAAGSLVVVAHDAKSGAALTDLSISQELTKSRTSPNRFTVRGLGGPPLVDGVVKGILPVASRLYVGAKGYAESRIDLADLKPGEPRTIEVALQAAGAAESHAPATIGGVVRDRKSHQPVAGVEVEAQCSDRGRWESQKATTDPQGHYRIEGVNGGHWNVQVKRSETVKSASHQIALAAGERRDDVDLELPAGVDVAGTVGGLAGFPAIETGLTFHATEAKDDDEFDGIHISSRFGWFGGQQAKLAHDGSYVVKSLAAGHYRVTLDLGGAQIALGPSSSANSPTHHALLGEVDVTDEASQHFDFDASAFVPGSVTVRVDGDATLRSSLIVVARTADPPAKEEPRGETFSFGGDGDEEDDPLESISGSDHFFSFMAFQDTEGETPGALANLGVDMTARLAPLPAGRWLVGLRRSDGAWTVDAPRPVALSNGENGEASLKLELASASIALVDATTRAPLANTSVRWLHATATREVGVTARTDADGRLSLTLPAGRVKLWHAPKKSTKKDDPALAVEFDWPPTDDAVAVRRKPGE